MNLEEIFKPQAEDIKQIEWTGDAELYDQELYELGQGESEFLIINPYLEDQRLIYYIDEFPQTEKCVIWTYNDQWVAKLFNNQWEPGKGYEDRKIIKPKLLWNRNPDIDKLMTFDEDIFNHFEPEPWDKNYKHVWYIDPRFNPLPDKVWVFSCQPMGKPIQGTKEMGYLIPDVTVEYNDQLPDFDIDINECCPPFWELINECVYELNPEHQTDERIWVIKFTPNYRRPRERKWIGTITPQPSISYNPKLLKLDYTIDYSVPWYDLKLEHTWMLDRKHLQNGEEDIWAVRVRFVSNPAGSKVVGYVSPEFQVEYNSSLGDVEFDIDYIPPWHDLKFEHMWMLDRKHLHNGEEDIWAVRAQCLKKPKGTKVIGSASPVLEIETNSELEGYRFEIDYTVPYHDFVFDHVWYLDQKFSHNQKIWAVKLKHSSNSQGWKEMGDIQPCSQILYNQDLRDLKIDLDYRIPYHDRQYTHVWYLDTKFTNGEKIWAAKMKASEQTQGEKEMGYITPVFPDKLDIIFISYREANAEENWRRVLSKAPWAKRIDGIKGIFEAHRAAAGLSSTDMFYVVDGDAWLVDDWEFDYQPGIFDRDCAYVWYSRNPLTKEEYGYGGVKLFSKKMMLKAKSMSKLDMTTSVMPKLKVMEKVSNETRFNTDEFTTWRSAFRECVKLYYNTQVKSNESEHQTRLNSWLSISQGDYQEFAVQGALAAVEYAKSNIKKYNLLLKINDREWLEKKFKKL